MGELGRSHCYAADVLVAKGARQSARSVITSNYNMTVWIWGGNCNRFSIATGFIKRSIRKASGLGIGTSFSHVLLCMVKNTAEPISIPCVVHGFVKDSLFMNRIRYVFDDPKIVQYGRQDLDRYNIISKIKISCLFTKRPWMWPWIKSCV